MKTAGVVFDFYDDLSGSLLKTAFPTPEELPDFIKTAHILNSEERGVLRDEAYALVMSNEGKILRKFACVDAGNTLLSCLYFEENAQKLPEEAVKVAAQNLASFCQDFGFEPTNFVKMAAAMFDVGKTALRAARDGGVVGGVAGGVIGGLKNQPVDRDTGKKRSRLMGAVKGVAVGAGAGASLNAGAGALAAHRINSIGGVPQHLMNHPTVQSAKHLFKTGAAGQSRTRDSMRQPLVGDEADWAARTNLVSIRGGADSGRVIPTANQMKTAEVVKEAKLPVALRGKSGMNVSFKLMAKDSPHADAVFNRIAANTAGKGRVKFQGGYERGAKSLGSQATRDASRGTFPKISTIVDVSNKVPVQVFEKRSSKRFALGNFYPLDSYADVSAAVHYFDDYWTTMNPSDRHEYAVKTASRADELGIETSELLARYGSTEYAPDIDAHLASRKAAAPAYGGVYDAMREKRAEVDPETFVTLLQKVDEEAGLNWYYGGNVTDPYLATFGGKEKAASSDWSWEGPNGETLNSAQLQGLVGKEEFNNSFDKDITSEFAKDPTAIFDSMPAPTKAIMARLALEE